MSDNQNKTPSRKPKGVISTLIFGVIKILLFALLGWFVLTVYFMATGFFKGFLTVLANAQAMLCTNIAFVQQGIFFEVFNKINALVFLNLNNCDSSLLITNTTLFSGRFAILNNLHLPQLLQLAVLSGEIVTAKLLAFVTSLPLFMLLILVSIVDGLVARDVRKFQGARETTFLFHRTKHTIGWLFFALFLVYVSLPLNISPLPFLLLQGMMVAVFVHLSATYFKKYV